MARSFKSPPGGTLTTLHSFDAPDGANPSAGLIQATDGNFYGTTELGGTSRRCTNGCGTVFQITPGGTLTTLHSFHGYDGANLIAGLVQATDGNFYGTTSEGGAAYNEGTVFQMTPEGTLTRLHSFDGTDGAYPEAGLIQATDGNFYGTTSAAVGFQRNGTVFKISPAGMLTTLFSFCGQRSCTDGSFPFAGLIQASDGNFYGTTSEGGTTRNCPAQSVGCGTVFEITPGGTLDSLYHFCAQTSCTDGYSPVGGLIQATDGNLYGTTQTGGAYGYGTVFSWPIVIGLTLSPTSVSFGTTVINTTSTVHGVTVANTGSVMLEISSVAASANFEVSSTTCGPMLAVGKKCVVRVTVTPTTLGKVVGTLTFNDNAPNSPQTVALSGFGVEPATLTPAGANFASQTVGTTSAPKAFTLTNNQIVALNNIVISTSGDFAVSSTTCTKSLAAKSKCTINVTFTPTATGTRKGQLSVSDSASNSPQTSNLTGTGK